MPESVTLNDLAADPARGLDLPVADAAALLVQAGGISEMLRVRLVAANVAVPASEPRVPEKRGDRMLTLDDVVERSRKSRGWWHTQWKKVFPTAVKKGRTVLIPEAAFEKW